MRNHAGLTVGGTSATVAIKSQMTPLQTENKSVNQEYTAKRNHPHPTCFQRRRPRPNEPLLSWRRRNSPMSTTISKTISATRVIIILGLLSSVLSTRQPCRTGSHTERSYRYVSLDYSKLLGLATYSPARYLMIQN